MRENFQGSTQHNCEFNPHLRILLVEDDQVDYLLTDRLLKQAYGDKFDLSWSDSGDDALRELDNSKFDICLIDYQLGQTNGLELLSLMNNAGHEEVPKILLTGMESLEIDRKATEAGATDYLVKNTLKSEQLERAIRYSLKQKKTERYVSFLAMHDALTGLANRALLLEHLERTISSTSRHQEYSAVLFVDLDNFKTINDSLGHNIGDCLLVETAKKLKHQVRDEDVVSRFGGDEFVLLFTRLGQNEAEARKRAIIIATKISQNISEPITIEGQDLQTSASIGVTIFCDSKTCCETILKQADIAMYRAKSNGRNAVSLFETSMQDMVQSDHSIEQDLDAAIVEQQMELHYQPIVSLDSNKIIGAEALIRWQHPDRGKLLPAEFIPEAEESDLICSIGKMVLQDGCSYLRNNPELAYLSVNIGSRHFDNHTFTTDLQNALDNTGVAAQRLVIELTENLFLKNPQSSFEKMKQLKQTGVRFALDDFGTGYSSLTILKDLPIDILKIDQSFTHCIHEDSAGEAIVIAIINMASALNLDVIVEGVEKTDQVEFLLAHSCCSAQGYVYSPPVPAETMSNMLSNGV